MRKKGTETNWMQGIRFRRAAFRAANFLPAWGVVLTYDDANGVEEQGFQFYFYSHETTEPPHVHVDKGGSSCKFWLSPVSLAKNYGYSEVELNRIRDIILEKQSFLASKWHEYFNRHKNG